MLNKLLYKLFGQDVWRIGLLKCSFYDLLHSNELSEKSKWLEFNARDDYEADPFLFKIKNNIYIAYEKFRYTKGNAKLQAVDFYGNKFNFFDNINKVKGHKSFPSFFYDGDDVYCIPEASDMGAIISYKFDFELNKFIYDSELLSGGGFVDSFLYKKDNIYYLFTSRIESPQRLELYISKNMHGPYEKHPCSPIVDDKYCGRNAGTLVNYEGKLYKLSQNCQQTYGGSVVCHEIKILNETDYVDFFISEIVPIFPYVKGVHTVSVLNEYIVIDGKLEVYRLSNLIRKLSYKLMKRIGIERSF